MSQLDIPAKDSIAKFGKALNTYTKSRWLLLLYLILSLVFKDDLNELSAISDSEMAAQYLSQHSGLLLYVLLFFISAVFVLLAFFNFLSKLNLMMQKTGNTSLKKMYNFELACIFVYIIKTLYTFSVSIAQMSIEIIFLFGLTTAVLLVFTIFWYAKWIKEMQTLNPEDENHKLLEQTTGKIYFGLILFQIILLFVLLINFDDTMIIILSIFTFISEGIYIYYLQKSSTLLISIYFIDFNGMGSFSGGIYDQNLYRGSIQGNVPNSILQNPSEQPFSSGNISLGQNQPNIVSKINKNLCPYCGAPKIDINSKFCSACGQNLL